MRGKLISIMENTMNSWGTKADCGRVVFFDLIVMVFFIV